MIDWAHQGDEFVVNNADDLLAGVDPRDNFLAQRPLGDALNEGVDDVEIDVCLEKRGAHFAQPVANIRFGQAAPAAKLLESVAQLFLNTIKHRQSRENTLRSRKSMILNRDTAAATA